MEKRFIGWFLVMASLNACRTAAIRPEPNAPSPAQNFQPFPIYTDSAPRHTHYVPSGYMGDSDLTMSGAYTATPHGQGPCLRVNYLAQGSKGWAGIYWQDPANNWGDVPGRAGYDLRGATRLSFWARGENGGEKIHEFRMGGIVGQYPDSDVASLLNVRLSKDWKEYSIDLSKKDLRHVIAGFGFFVNKAENPGGITIYLDDIYFIGPRGMQTAISTGTLPASGQAPVVTTPPPPAPPPLVPKSTKELNVKETEAGLRVSFSSQLLFSSGKAVLNPGSNKVLDQLVGLLSAYPENAVLVEGHTDNTGSATFNLKLSELRAISVRNYLIKQGGFDPARFKVTGYGATHPLTENSTASGRALNRRVELTILKTAKP